MNIIVFYILTNIDIFEFESFKSFLRKYSCIIFLIYIHAYYVFHLFEFYYYIINLTLSINQLNKFNI